MRNDFINKQEVSELLCNVGIKTLSSKVQLLGDTFFF